MFSIPKALQLLAWAAASLHVLAAAAQGPTTLPPSAEPTAPRPTDAKAAVPAALYRSPFTGYQTYTDTPVASWRDINDLVRQRGGWRAYAREASEPALAKPGDAAAPATVPSAEAGHGDHPQK